MEYEYELFHWGIKGQKWGVRRFQNKDGSLTPAGKKRQRANYSEEAKRMSDQELRSKIKRMNLEKRYYDMSKGSSKASEALDIANQALNTSSKAGKITKDGLTLSGKETAQVNLVNQGVKGLSSGVSAAKKISDASRERANVKKNRARVENMSDKDLETIVNRMDLERQYSNLSGERVARGRVSALDALKIAGDVLTVGASATAIAVGIHKLRSGK